MDHNSTERQTNVPMGTTNNDQNGHAIYNNTGSPTYSNGICMPNRDPIDLQFRNITYTVNLGFNKGMLRFYFYIRVFFSYILFLFNRFTFGLIFGLSR